MGSQKRIRTVVIGAGWGGSHARVISELSDQFELLGICSRRIERGRSVAEAIGLPGITVTSDWHELVDMPGVDLTVIASPDAHHHEMTCQAIQTGSHVFCDKPLAMSVEHAAEMLRLADARGVCHATGFTWRFAPIFASLADEIDAGRVGWIRGIDAHFTIRPPLPGKEWQFDPRLRIGGVIGNLGVHVIDLALWLLGRANGEVSPTLSGWQVWCEADLVGREGGPVPVVNDIAWIQMRSPEFGSLGRLDAPEQRQRAHIRVFVSQNDTYRAPDPVGLTVHGERRTYEAVANPLDPMAQSLSWVEQTSHPRSSIKPLRYPGGLPHPPSAERPSGGLLYPTLVHLYRDHIGPRIAGRVRFSDGDGEMPTFSSGLRAQYVLESALASARTGAWVNVGDQVDLETS